MRIDTPTIQAIAASAATGARAARWVPIVATVLATAAAVLLASGLAVVMNLS
jgi:hypothetical protein